MKSLNCDYFRVLVIFKSLILAFFLTACGSQKDVDKIGDAQQCLNDSTATTAMSCVSKVEGMSTTGANNIRCAAAFIREGFATPTKYTAAFDSLKGTSGTSAFMGLITFSSTGNITTDTANANTTFTDCYNAAAKGKTLISAFGYMSTALLNFFSEIGGGTKCNSPTSSGYNLSQCIVDAGVANPTGFATIVSTNETDSSAAGQVQSSIGTVIISTYSISCTGSGANKELCDKLSTAINSGGGTTNPRGVAVKFLSTIITVPTP